MRLEVSFPDDVNTIFVAIEDDARSGFTKALTEVAEEIPGLIQENILSLGTRGGNPAYPDVSRGSLAFRETWPASPDAQDAYVEAHTPLVDTKRMLTSYGVKMTDSGDEMVTFEVTSDTDYAWRHEFGEGVNQLGNPLHERPHMYITSNDAAMFDRIIVGSMK